MAMYSALQRDVQKEGKKKRQNKELINERKRNPENQKTGKRQSKVTKKMRKK
jgi:hypothetical protein